MAAPKEPLRIDVARVDADQAKHVEIVSQEMSADGRELAIVLKPTSQQFTVDFDLTGRDFKRVRITVRGVKKTEVARYFTDVNRKIYIELTRLPGVDISRFGDDMVIDFATPKAALVLPPEGRLLFKQMYVRAGEEDKP